MQQDWAVIQLHHQGTRRTEVWTHTLVAWRASTLLDKSRLSLATAKECKIRIMVEMEKDENMHRVHKWYVAKGID